MSRVWQKHKLLLYQLRQLVLSDIENQTTEEESEDCEVVEAEPVIVIPARTPATGSEEDDSRAKKRTPPTAVFGRRRSQYTPRKGQTKRKVDLHVEREKRCNGKVLCFRISNRDDPNKADVRRKCRAYGRNTSFYCTGCANWCCHGGHSLNTKQRRKNVMKNLGLKKIPDEHVRVPVQDAEEGGIGYVWTNNSCYHILHREKFTMVEHEGEEEGEESDSASSTSNT